MQVGSLPAVTTSLCPVAGITVDSVITSPHSEQYPDSAYPASVHVGALPAVTTTVCPVAGI